MTRALFLLVAVAAFFTAGCRTAAKPEPQEQALERFEYEQPQMGVPFRIVLYATNEQHALTAAQAAFSRIAELNHILSDYETDSELSELSQSSEQGGKAVKLSPDLWKVLRAAQRMATNSDGAFDVTIGPCAALWRKARREKELPDTARLANAKAKVGYQSLLLDDAHQTARLARFGMRLDLGGIAKGYAADEARRTLRQFGITRALVAASGDLSLGEPPPGAPGWKVELSAYDPEAGRDKEFLILSNCGVASSGDLFQRLEIGGVRYSHILNPFTCIGMTNHALSTVVARDCMTADSLSTPLTILDPVQGLKLARKYQAAVRIIQMKVNKPEVTEDEKFRALLREANDI